MGNNSRLRDMAAAFVAGDVPGVADIHICGDATSTQTPYQYWNKWARGDKDCFHTTLTLAHAATTTGRNDVVLVSPDSHTQAATLTWSRNMTHMIGMYPTSMMNQRARIGHNANFDNLIDVTGYGNLFKNIYLMYGRGNAANLTCLSVTGNRNTFKNCHFNSPTNATEADEATFKVIEIAESEQYFDHCTIGTEATLMTDGEIIKLTAACSPRLVFEDCNILMRSDANAPRFIDDSAGTGQGFVIFKNCVIHNFGTELTFAFATTGIAAGTDYIFAGDTTVGGAADVIAGAHEAKMFVPAKVGVTEDAYAGLSIPVDQG